MRRISPHVSPIRPRIAPTDEPRTSASPPRPAPSSPPESPPPTYPTHRTNRRILALALPTFGQLIAEPVFILIDTAIVGHIGDDALAGLSIGSTIMLTTVGLCVFLAYGTTSQVAHLIGAGKRREGLETGIDGMWLALAIGLAVGAAILLASTPLCMAMGGRGAVLNNAVAYVRTIVLGLPGMLVVYAANGIFRGLGRVRLTLIAAVSGAVINTVLDVVFVFHLRWGIAGSGLATFLAQWCMALILVVPALRWARQAGARWIPRLGGILGTARNGIPLFVRTLALRISMVATVMLATSMGTSALASYQVVNANWNAVINMLDAIGIAGQALVATQLGAGRQRQALEVARRCARFGLFGGIAIGIGMAAFGWMAAGLFSPAPHIQWLIALGMTVQAVFLPLGGWMWALDGILIGAEDYRYLAFTCTAVAAAYLMVLAATAWFDAAFRLDDGMRTVVLWTVINAVFVGGRAICNGRRIRGTAWMVGII